MSLTIMCSVKLVEQALGGTVSWVISKFLLLGADKEHFITLLELYLEAVAREK